MSEDLDVLAHRIARQVRRSGGSSTPYEDLAQAARIGAWAAEQSYNADKGVPKSKWLALRAYGSARSEIRKSARRQARAVPVSDRHQVCQLRPTLIDLDRALASLGDEDRKLIILLYVEGMTLAEASHYYGVAIATVSNWRNAAIERMREYFTR